MAGSALARRGLLVFALAWLAAPGGTARAGTLEALVQGGDGDPVEHAVVYAIPTRADGDARPPSAEAQPAEITQKNKEYVPYVTAVQVGAKVAFPNRDRVRHHVYSFSEAKTFEIPLYRGTPPEPVLFDKPGPVTLGCNIHDWMKGYVFVAPSGHFGVTGKDGRSVLADLPEGSYAVQVWHPRLKGEPEATAQSVSLNGAGPAALTFPIEQKRVWKPRRAPSAGARGYR